MIYGYARVSTGKQAKGNSLEEQEEAITEQYPTADIRKEAYSGAKTNRPVFTKLLSELREGDMLIVSKFDRFCRSTLEGLTYVRELKERGIKIHILNMGIIENTPMGNLIVTLLLAFAEFERAMILERTSSGKAIAKLKPDFKEGRPKKEIPDFEKFLQKQKDGEITVEQGCKQLGISRSQWYILCRKIS